MSLGISERSEMTGNPTVKWDGEWDGDRPEGWAQRVIILDEPPARAMGWDERFPPLSPERQSAALERVTRERARREHAAARKPKTPSTYLISAEGSPLVKIGFTTGKPKARMGDLQTGVPMKLSLLWCTEGDYEDDLHARFAEYRVIGEWFDLTPLGDPVEVVSAAAEELQAANAEMR
jgi:hypothetical protein